MAKVHIKIVRAYDSTRNGLVGTMVTDMFRPLSDVVTIDETKASTIAAAAQAICEKYASSHPRESFMPVVSVNRGERTPTNLKKVIDGMERQWLRVEPSKK